MGPSFQIFPVGFIRKTDAVVSIEILDEYTDALLGLDGFSHIMVFYWFHRNDATDKRRVLRVHPRKDLRKPLTGVFATHAPLRPNLIGMTICKIRSMHGSTIVIEDIDAFDGTPVIDIKCYIPESTAKGSVRLPAWV